MSTYRNSCRFTIVRHGETEWNVARIIQGQVDSPLTEKGISDAKNLAEKFTDIHFDEVFSSDLIRAKRTAEIISSDRALAITTNELLRERSFGRFEGVKVDEYRHELQDLIKQRDSLSDPDQNKFDLGNGIETGESMIGRFITFLREVAVAYPGKNILVVSHGAIMCALLVHLGYATYKELENNGIRNLGYFILESDGIEFLIKKTHGITKTHSESAMVS